jgi:hypothetical protein
MNTMVANEYDARHGNLAEKRYPCPSPCVRAKRFFANIRPLKPTTSRRPCLHREAAGGSRRFAARLDAAHTVV